MPHRACKERHFDHTRKERVLRENRATGGTVLAYLITDKNDWGYLVSHTCEWQPIIVDPVLRRGEVA